MGYQCPAILLLGFEGVAARNITTALRTGRYALNHVSGSRGDFAVHISKGSIWAELRTNSATLSK